MKKFMYLAVMALTLGFFASCTPRSSVGKEPVVDETNATINGVHYDNTEYACWQFDWEYTEKETGEQSYKESGTEFFWTTEFEAQKMKAEFDYTHNVSASAYGVSYTMTGSSKVTKTNHTQEECYDQYDE